MFIIDDVSNPSSTEKIEDIRNSLVEILKNFMPHENRIKNSSASHIK